MELTYAKQREIEDAIINILKSIGQPLRARIEILDGDQQVIEVDAGDNGKWLRTGWHRKSSDDNFSTWPEFSAIVPSLNRTFIELALLKNSRSQK